MPQLEVLKHGISTFLFQYMLLFRNKQITITFYPRVKSIFKTNTAVSIREVT